MRSSELAELRAFVALAERNLRLCIALILRLIYMHYANYVGCAKKLRRIEELFHRPLCPQDSRLQRRAS